MSGPGRLTDKEMEQLKKFGRCYNRKQKGHAARRYTQPARLYLTISAQLQEVELVEEANKLEKE